mgnify:FL=1
MTIAIAACSSEGSAAPSPTASPAVTVSDAPTPTTPVLVPEGTAEDNLAVFTWVTETVWDSDDRVKGRAYIDALEDAGFDREDMEVTRDESTVGNPAESIQFSVLWRDECIVGQVGPSTEKPTAVVLPELPEGGCLVGQTRPIDW